MKVQSGNPVNLAAIACAWFFALAVLLTAGCHGDNDSKEAEPAPVYTTANTPIGTLLEDPAALAIVQKYVPQFANSSLLSLVANSSLKGIQGYAASILTDEVLAAIDAEFAELTPLPGLVLVGDVNYDENAVEPYELPDPLVLSDGRPVRDAQTWWNARRPEIFEIFSREVYGRSPDRPAGEYFEVTETAASAFGGKAYRTQVVIHFSNEEAAPGMNLILYVPANAALPAPVLLVAGFSTTTRAFDDPDLAEGEDSQLPAFPDAGKFLDAGFAVAAINYQELSPDDEEGYVGSLRAYFDNAQTEEDRPADAWGATAAWGWGLSRAQDYLEEDTMVDAGRVAVYGASRLGRAVLWAGARDQRFAAVVACCSGKLGASLLRRNYGETLRGDPSYYYAKNLGQYVDNIDALDVDSHMLLALIAPRPVMLQTGIYDHAADPKGEFLAAVAAGPVYELLGGAGLGVTESAWPLQDPILNDIGFYLRDGGHGPDDGSYDLYLEFIKKHLLPGQ